MTKLRLVPPIDSTKESSKMDRSRYASRDRRFDHSGDFLLPLIGLLFLVVAVSIGTALAVWLDRWLPGLVAVVIAVLVIGTPTLGLGLILLDTRRR